jgi:hypothetical protein
MTFIIINVFINNEYYKYIYILIKNNQIFIKVK